MRLSVTVAVAVKVFDGLVLAADSATTLQYAPGRFQVYNNANKIFHLHRNLPIGGMTWGLGQIGNASISTLAKDLRRRFMGNDPLHPDWELDPATYTVKAVAERVTEMMFSELYSQIYTSPGPGILGFLVAGYSGGSLDAEAWRIVISDPATTPVLEHEIQKDQSGWGAYAQPEAAHRLFNGFDEHLHSALLAAIPAGHHAQVDSVLAAAGRQVVVAAMPFADAINFAQFLVDVTVGYTRFLLGPDVVGGPVEVAGITRHEGFKWISRKHYYPAALNPKDPHGDY